MGRVRDTAAQYDISVRGVESWATEPAFIDFLARDMKAKLEKMPEKTKVLFTAHSLPQRIIDGGDPYPDELRSTAEAVASQLGLSQWSQWSIAWQSAGRTPEPWIGPDILAVIDDFAATRTTDEPIDGVLVSACGFVADHLEVLYDLDIEAAKHANDRGLAFSRTASVNNDPGVMAALAARVLAA
jgi:ferrochelatase